MGHGKPRSTSDSSCPTGFPTLESDTPVGKEDISSEGEDTSSGRRPVTPSGYTVEPEPIRGLTREWLTPKGSPIKPISSASRPSEAGPIYPSPSSGSFVLRRGPVMWPPVTAFTSTIVRPDITDPGPS